MLHARLYAKPYLLPIQTHRQCKHDISSLGLITHQQGQSTLIATKFNILSLWATASRDMNFETIASLSSTWSVCLQKVTWQRQVTMTVFNTGNCKFEILQGTYLCWHFLKLPFQYCILTTIIAFLGKCRLVWTSEPLPTFLSVATVKQLGFQSRDERCSYMLQSMAV